MIGTGPRPLLAGCADVQKEVRLESYQDGTERKGRVIDPPYNSSGNGLLSHTVTRAVPSALEGLTAEFGMGSGVTPPLWSPELKLPR